MLSMKRQKLFIILILLLVSFGVGFSFQPKFDFSTTSYPSGEVNISGQVSSGTSVKLYINDNYISNQEVYAKPVYIYLSNSIENVQVPIGSTLIFINNATGGRIYKLNISSVGEYKVLNHNDKLEFKSFKSGDVSYTDEAEGVSKVISIINKEVPFNFTNMQDNLVNGKNDLKFVINPINTGDFEPMTINREVDYNKYSVVIKANLSSNITSSYSVNVSGFISDSDSKLFYVLNNEGKIANTGILNPIKINGNSFNFSINNLVEGNNTIRLISTEKNNENIFNGEKVLKVLVDTIPPYLHLNSATYQGSVINGKRTNIKVDLSKPAYINSNNLLLNFSTDGDVINYTFNDKNFSVKVKNDSVLISLNLVQGENNLTLHVFDIAGNEYREAHEIHYSNKQPDIVSDSLKPKDMFQGVRTCHFPYQSIQGKINEGDVKVTVFSFPEGAKDSNGSLLTCDEFKPLFTRNLGDLSYSQTYGSEYKPSDEEMSLTSLIFQKKTFTTKSDGSFGGGNFLSSDSVIIGLQEKDFTSSDLNQANNEKNSKTNPKVGSVSSDNTVCFVMQDRYGNTNVRSFNVKLDEGNTMWKKEEVITIPDTVYSGEIESNGDERQGNGAVRFGVIAKFQYTGPGKISDLSYLRVFKSSGSDTDKVRIITTEMNYKLDKNTGELTVYFPVEMKKLGIDPMKYPKSMEFWFEAMPTYTVNNVDIPIDDKNPIYFKVGINVERPLDHTKWLTPAMINKVQKFLNKSISLTKEGVKYLGYASIAGVLTCTGAKFIFGAEMGMLNPKSSDYQSQVNKLKHNLFLICDRVACTASPKRCVGNLGTTTPGNGVINVGGKDSLDSVQLSKLGADVESPDGTKLADFSSIVFGGPCSYSGNGKMDGVKIRKAQVNTYEDSTGFGNWKSTTTGSRLIIDKCVPASYKNKKPDIKNLQNVNLNGVSGACFSPGAPEFDDTRCNFFGLDPEGAAGWNPADNIIESIRCGCITDTYSHLRNYLKIEEGIYNCLSQAKVGNVKGSYCERLMGQAVCDIATNVIFKTIAQSSVRGGDNGKDPHKSVFINALQGLQKGDKLLNERYKGTFFSQAGLGTEQIVNKACLAAVTGDWSILSENILSSINKNEVKPIFGPPFPESRFQGYNPLTGELSISYRFTYGVVSGGQSIRTKVVFICNPSAPGSEYCPSDGYVTTEDSNVPTKIRTMNLYVGKGQTKDETIVVTDTGAKFRFNQLQLINTYSLNGKEITQTMEPVDIFAKGDLFAQCHFTGGLMGSGAGFSCETLFSNNALMSGYQIDDSRTKILPSDIFYPGNSLYVNLGYDVRNADVNQKGFDLKYLAECNGLKANSKAVRMGTISFQGINGYGNKVKKLFTIPSIGIVNNEKTNVYTSSLSQIDLNKIYGNKNIVLLINSTGKDNSNGVFSITDKQNIAFTTPIIDNTAVGNGVYYSIDWSKVSKNADMAKMSLTVKSTVPLSIAIVNKSSHELVLPFGLSEEIKTKTYSDFSTIQEGQCTLKLRILPLGKGRKISTPKEFDTYNPLGNSSDISTNVKQTDVVTKTFYVKNKPKQNNKYIAFAFKDFGKNSFLYADNKMVEIPYIYETSDNTGGESIDAVVTLSKFVGKSEDRTKLILGDGGKLDFDLSTFTGMKENTTYDATLNYKITGSEDINNKKKNTLTGSINFKIYYGKKKGEKSLTKKTNI